MESTKNTEQELQAQKDSFIATLGHDLKNPIIAQIKSLELLLNGFSTKCLFVSPSLFI